MRSNYQIAVAVTAGVAIGVIAVQGLHAQARPPVFFVADIDVTNPDAYAKEYAPKAQAIIKEPEVAFIGGSAVTTGTVTPFDGGAPKRVVVQVW